MIYLQILLKDHFIDGDLTSALMTFVQALISSKLNKLKAWDAIGFQVRIHSEISIRLGCSGGSGIEGIKQVLEIDCGLFVTEAIATRGVFHKDPKLNLSLSWTSQLWKAVSIFENVL